MRTAAISPPAGRRFAMLLAVCLAVMATVAAIGAQGMARWRQFDAEQRRSIYRYCIDAEFDEPAQAVRLRALDDPALELRISDHDPAPLAGDGSFYVVTRSRWTLRRYSCHIEYLDGLVKRISFFSD